MALVDRWTLTTGAFLRFNPVARLLFLIYLILLHVLVLVIIGFHTNHLDEELNDGKVDGMGGGPAGVISVLENT